MCKSSLLSYSMWLTLRTIKWLNGSYYGYLHTPIHFHKVEKTYLPVYENYKKYKNAVRVAALPTSLLHIIKNFLFLKIDHPGLFDTIFT